MFCAKSFSITVFFHITEAIPKAAAIKHEDGALRSKRAFSSSGPIAGAIIVHSSRWVIKTVISRVRTVCGRATDSRNAALRRALNFRGGDGMVTGHAENSLTVDLDSRRTVEFHCNIMTAEDIHHIGMPDMLPLEN